MGLLHVPWEQGGSGGQLHHIFRPLMVRRTENKLFLHESEQSAISCPLHFIRNLSTLHWPYFPRAFQNFVQLPFPGSGSLCLTLDLGYVCSWNSNPGSWLNAQMRRKYLSVCVAIFPPLPTSSVYVPCSRTCLLFLSLHFNPGKIFWHCLPLVLGSVNPEVTSPSHEYLDS